MLVTGAAYKLIEKIVTVQITKYITTTCPLVFSGADGLDDHSIGMGGGGRGWRGGGIEIPVFPVSHQNYRTGLSVVLKWTFKTV